MDTFAKFGFGFQTKLIASFLSDRDFAKQIVGSLDSKYFENTSLKWLVENSVAYFSEYKLQPTLDVFKVQLSNLEKGSLLQTECIKSIKDIYSNLESDDLKFIKDETVKFLRHQHIKNAFESSISLLEKGKYEEIVKLITDSANKVQVEHNIGQDYLNDIDFRYSEQGEVKRIPTGWKVIDDLMQGGLPIGKFGFWMGDQGVGKCVGPLTEIEIEYEQIGIPIFDNDGNEKSIMWIDPWDEFTINDIKLFGWQIELLLNYGVG